MQKTLIHLVCDELKIEYPRNDFFAQLCIGLVASGWGRVLTPKFATTEDAELFAKHYTMLNP
jgi:hypothetical protein